MKKEKAGTETKRFDIAQDTMIDILERVRSEIVCSEARERFDEVFVSEMVRRGVMPVALGIDTTYRRGWVGGEMKIYKILFSVWVRFEDAEEFHAEF